MTDTPFSLTLASDLPQRSPCRTSTDSRGYGMLGVALRFGVLVVALVTAPAHANPTGAQVASGSATFNTNASTLTVTNSNNAIINWQVFSINTGETTRFVQPSATSSVLNRVQGGDPSQLLGQLQSNGKVFLINPAGIMVGEGARIDVGALVASTLGLSDEDFLAGRLNFIATSNAGSVVNLGLISTGLGGTVVLSGPVVSNEGSISTPQGQTVLAAGQTVRLTELGAPGLSVEIAGTDTSATNLGQITADAGTIGIVGALVKNRGVASASSVTREGGRIFLRASRDAYVEGNGRLAATGLKGGQIEVTGERVALMDTASLDASGEQGGGRVMVGGDYQGKNPAVANAQQTYFGPDALIKVDATQSGDGGTAVVWADGSTRAHGTISARGGASNGAGGLIETSGKQTLDVRGIRVDTRAADGTAGTWLLDPTDINIVPGSSGGGLSGSTVTDGDINNATANIVITTQSSNTENGDITVQPGVYIYNSIYELSLQADRDIVLQSANVNSSAVSISAARDILITDSVIDTSGQMDIAAGRNLAVKSALATGSASMPGAGLVTWGGAQNITVGDTLTVQGSPTVSSGSATISSYGSQVINARQIDVIAGGTGGVNVSQAGATIKADGSQTINAAVGGVGGILLRGGGGVGGYLNSAVIAHGSSAGDQTINLKREGSSIVLQGGAGTGDGSTSESMCGGSCNHASIENGLGGTSITFTGSGNSLTLTGGGAATDYGHNDASIRADAGVLTIGSTSSRADIVLTGGNAGGRVRLDTTGGPVLNTNGLPESDGNGASLEGRSGVTIFANHLTLSGGDAPAGITGINSAGDSANAGSIAVNATGNLTMNGGAGNSAFPQYPFLSGAVGIGADLNVDINLTVGGDLQMTGGGPSASALIGSLAADSTATVVTSIAGKAELKASGAGLAAVGSGLAARDGVSGVIARDLTAGSIFLESSNDVSLEGPLTATGNGIAVNALGNFVNNATTPFVLTGGGRWLVYAAAPANVTKNGLTSDFRRYKKTYASYPPAGVTESGNGFIYASAPTVSVDTSLATGSASHEYGDRSTATWSYALSGSFADSEDTGFGVITGSAAYAVPARSSNAGSYSVAYASGLSSSTGYTLIPGMGVAYSVLPRSISVTANTQTKVYGDALPSLTYAVGGSGLVNGDTLTGALATTAAASSSVGDYAISQGTLAAGSNYSISSFTGSTLIVTPAVLTLTAGSLSKVYGEANPTLTYTAAGFKLSDTASVIATQPLLSTTATTRTGVGSVPITISGADAGVNYSLSYVDGTLTIDPRGISIVADAQSKVYGDALPSLTYAVGGSGLVNGDTLTGALATTAAASSSVGDYAISQGTLAAGSNYSISSFTGSTLSVTPANLSVTANDATKTYDGQAFSGGNGVTYSGFVLGDTAASLGGTLSYSGTSQGARNAGTYSIIPSGLSSGNYLIHYIDGTLMILRATVGVVSLSGSRAYDGSRTVAADIFSLSGLANGENLTLTGAGRIANPDVGTYSTAQGTLNLDMLALGNGTGSGAGLAGNYTLDGGAHVVAITRLSNVAWVGGGTGDWLGAGNWAGGAVPINNNVAQININSPLAATSSQAVNLGSTKVVSAGDFSLDVTGGFTSGAGVLDVTGNLNITTHSPMTIGSGGITSTGGITLQAATADRTSTIALNGAISSTGGAVDVQAYSNITQSSSISAPSVRLASGSGSISLTSSALTDSANITYSAPSGFITYSTLNFTGSTPTLDSSSLVNTATSTTSSVTQPVAASTTTSLDSAINIVSNSEPVLTPTTLRTSDNTNQTTTSTTTSSTTETSTSTSNDTSTRSTDSSTNEGGGGTTVSTVALSPTTTTTTTTTSTTPTSTLPGGTIGGGTDEFGGTTTTTVTSTTSSTTTTTTDTSTGSTTTTSSGESTTTTSSSGSDSSTQESSSSGDSKSQQTSTADSKEDKQQKEASNGRTRKPSPKMCT